MSRKNGTDIDICESGAIERPRYFPRQMISAEDLNQEQRYFRNKLRRHNRLLHGWGVVCGAMVCPKFRADGSMEPWKVKVKPGYILGPYGDEIVIDCEACVDLRTSGLTGVTGAPVSGVDPWCSEIFVQRDSEEPLYLAVKYKEIQSRPVRVQPSGCGCDESACEYSRWRDGYELAVLSSEQYARYVQEQQSSPAWNELFQTPDDRSQPCVPECWPCASQPWVVLACITVNAAGLPITINNRDPRRLVAALGCFHWSCHGVAEIASINEIACGQLAENPIVLDRAAGSTTTLAVVGEGFQQGLRLELGAGVRWAIAGVIQPTNFTVNVQVDPTAVPGARDLVVLNPDCSTAVCTGALLVPEAESSRGATASAGSASKKTSQPQKPKSKASATKAAKGKGASKI